MVVVILYVQFDWWWWWVIFLSAFFLFLTIENIAVFVTSISQTKIYGIRHLGDRKEKLYTPRAFSQVVPGGFRNGPGTSNDVAVGARTLRIYNMSEAHTATRYRYLIMSAFVIGGDQQGISNEMNVSLELLISWVYIGQSILDRWSTIQHRGTWTKHVRLDHAWHVHTDVHPTQEEINHLSP